MKRQAGAELLLKIYLCRYTDLTELSPVLANYDLLSHIDCKIQIAQ